MTEINLIEPKTPLLSHTSVWICGWGIKCVQPPPYLASKWMNYFYNACMFLSPTMPCSSCSHRQLTLYCFALCMFLMPHCNSISSVHLLITHAFSSVLWCHATQNAEKWEEALIICGLGRQISQCKHCVCYFIKVRNVSRKRRIPLESVLD